MPPRPIRRVSRRRPRGSRALAKARQSAYLGIWKAAEPVLMASRASKPPSDGLSELSRLVTTIGENPAVRWQSGPFVGSPVPVRAGPSAAAAGPPHNPPSLYVTPPLL